ncbi:MAG: prolyl oligopeptidase family serine peptidase [Actinomycetota bacterium]|nr:prolyl oligopeptidase family serine peptidase [Actinomycetota bacterium]
MIPAVGNSSASPVPVYPPAHRLDLVDQIHGRHIADPYRWLESADSPETQAWVAAQTELFNGTAAAWSTRIGFAARIRQLMATGDIGLPRYRGQRRFFTRRAPDGELPVLYTVDGADTAPGSERALIDPLVIDPGGTTTLDAWTPSPSGTLIAVQLSTGGTEDSELIVVDVDTGATVDGPISRCRFSSIGWLADESGFYYVRREDPATLPEEEASYHRRIRLRRFIRHPDEDALVFGLGRDKASIFSADTDHSGRWLLVHSQVGTQHSNEVWLADLASDDPEHPRFVPVITGHDVETRAHIADDGRLYLLTDLDAPRFRLAVADPHSPAVPHWTTLLAEDSEAVLTDVAILDCADSRVVVALRARHALSEIRVHDLRGGSRSAVVTLPVAGTVSQLRSRYGGGHEVWFDLTAFDRPTTVYCFDANAGVLSVHERAPGLVHREPQITVQQVSYRSADGATVRMFILAPAAAPDRLRPTVLTGYGGFSVARTPNYTPSAIAWVEAGGVYAVANLRGGSEEGSEWHEAGYREHKQNVFDDFHSADEYLICSGWTSPDDLGIQGESNGGLLVGAALTQRPDLYRAVVCSAPLLDLVRYEQFGLGRFWSHEYGSAADPEELGWLLSYSPYHHVVPGVSYPATMFTVFDGDTRVDVLHARKMCAALQAATSASRDDHPILFRLESGVGHGARAASRTAGLAADQLAFFAHYLGIDDAEARHAVPT